MIKLFQSTDKLFSSNGDKIIIPLRAKIHKEDNGSFYLDLETSLDYVNDLVEGAIIVAPTPQGEQAFRVNNVSKTRTKITTKCYHVFYDSINYLIADSYVVDKNCNDALNHLNNATQPTSPFSTMSNITTIDSYRCVRSSLYEAIQTVLERWGGHLVRDNWNISILNSIGQDNGVTVRYAKNLKEITCEENWDNVVTELLPVGKDGILLDNLYVYSTKQYAIPYTKTISFSQDINEEDYETEEEYEQALKTDLLAQATDYVERHSIPQMNYTIKANLEKITDIGDTIEVIDERLGVDIMTNLISYDYDCILNKYTELEFGNFLPSLNNLISNIKSDTTEAINDMASSILSNIYHKLTGQYCIFEGSYILIVDTLPKEEAENVFRIDNTGLHYSSTGINGTYDTVWSIDNIMNFDNISVENLKLELDNIIGGTLKIGGADNTNGTIEVYDQNDDIILTINKKGISKLNPIELYSNVTGSTGTILLSETLANFSSIEIMYTDGIINEQKRINNPNAKTITLSLIRQGSTPKNTYIHRTEYSLNGTSATPTVTNAGYILIQDTNTSTTVGINSLYITKIIGWK